MSMRANLAQAGMTCYGYESILTHDRAALVATKERLAAGKAPQRVDNLIENFGNSYADVLLWHRLCPTSRSSKMLRQRARGSGETGKSAWILAH